MTWRFHRANSSDSDNFLLFNLFIFRIYIAQRLAFVSVCFCEEAATTGNEARESRSHNEESNRCDVSLCAELIPNHTSEVSLLPAEPHAHTRDTCLFLKTIGSDTSLTISTTEFFFIEERVLVADWHNSKTLGV